MRVTINVAVSADAPEYWTLSDVPETDIDPPESGLVISIADIAELSIAVSAVNSRKRIVARGR